VRKALQVLQRECTGAGVNAELLEEAPGDKPGNLRSVLLALEGDAAQPLASRWRGSVQWSCTSPYRPQHKRKNWFIGVEVFESDGAATSAASNSELLDKHLRFETLRASGPGGQHVNKTDSAVRATHLPTGLSVKVQTDRSLHANKRLARALLAHKLASAAAEDANAARSERWQQHYGVERGNAERVFKGMAFVEAAQSGYGEVRPTRE
jgi:peptide chain release factor